MVFDPGGLHPRVASVTLALRREQCSSMYDPYPSHLVRQGTRPPTLTLGGPAKRPDRAIWKGGPTHPREAQKHPLDPRRDRLVPSSPRCRSKIIEKHASAQDWPTTGDYPARPTEGDLVGRDPCLVGRSRVNKQHPESEQGRDPARDQDRGSEPIRRARRTPAHNDRKECRAGCGGDQSYRAAHQPQTTPRPVLDRELLAQLRKQEVLADIGRRQLRSPDPDRGVGISAFPPALSAIGSAGSSCRATRVRRHPEKTESAGCPRGPQLETRLDGSPRWGVSLARPEPSGFGHPKGVGSTHPGIAGAG